MKILSPVLGRNGDLLFFWCPGCNDLHAVNVVNDPAFPGLPAWKWDGRADEPTFSPSIKVSFPANPKASEEFKEWRRARVCHSFVRGGNIQFLGDCTHAFAGQTVPLPPLPSYLANGEDA